MRTNLGTKAMSDRQIGHNRNLNRMRAVFVAILAVIPLVVAAHMATFLSSGEFYLVFIFAGIGLLILALAWWLWHRAPRTRATLEISDDGFFLEVASLFHVVEQDVIWSDLREIRLVKGGYGVRNIEFLLTHDASVRLGLVQPTTRQSAPDVLVGRKLSVPLALLEEGGAKVIEALTVAADKAGYEIARTGWREYLVLSYEIFRVTPKG